MVHRHFALCVVFVAFTGITNSPADEPSVQEKIDALKQSVSQLEQRINTLEAALQKPSPDKSFEWSEFGAQLVECDSSTVKAVREFDGGRYQGAMVVRDVESDSLASEAGLERGDLLLGIGKWETTSVRDLSFIDRKHKQSSATAKTRFYILRDGKTLFGYLNL